MGRKLVLALVAAVLVLAPMAAGASIIAVSSGDWTGSRSSADGGLVPGGKWADSANNGIEVQWEIIFDGGLYNYRYTLIGADGGDVDPDVSHWILQVSDPAVAGDFQGIDSGFITEDSPGTFVQDNSNPSMPGSMYGIKFEEGPNDGLTYAFQSAREPVWGDIYIKDGKDGDIFTVAWNTGFGTEPDGTTTDFTSWVPRPDGSTSPVPIPPSVLLLGCGLLGLMAFRKRSNRIS